MPERPDTRIITGTPIVAGVASGPVIVLDEPLSLWGGLDPVTGTIIDARHPQASLCVSGAIVAMAHGRGSSSASSVLVEAVRLGTAPAAFVLAERDEIIALGCLVARELYDLTIPVVVVTASPLGEIFTTGAPAAINGSTVRQVPSN